jgi:hypothetical protein
MADVVYLHVGAPKTGTTYLQDRLYANREALADHGIHYPIGTRPDLFAPALDLIDRWWGGQRDGVRGEWESLMGRVGRASGTVVVSHEILAGATREQVARAMADLAGAEVHVVYSARDIARQIPAEWQETVKHQNGKPFRHFLREVQGAERRDSRVWFWRAQGLPDVLSRWAAGLPPEQVHLVTVPQPGAPPDALWERYCQALRLDPALAPEAAGRTNQSVGIDESALLRQLNRRLKRAGLDAASYRRIVREVVVHQTLAERPGMRRVTLPPRAHAWALEIAEEWIEWAAGSGIDVVGDLADLRPVFPEGEAWVDADRPKPRLMTDAALDALVAVIMDAAGRPEPEQSPVALIGRAARRLRGQ